MTAAAGVRVGFVPVVGEPSAERAEVHLTPVEDTAATADRVVVGFTPMVTGAGASLEAQRVRVVFSPVGSRDLTAGQTGEGGISSSVGGGVSAGHGTEIDRAENTPFQISTTKKISDATVTYDTGGNKERIEKTFLRIKTIVAKALCKIESAKGQIASERVQDFRFAINPQTRAIRWKEESKAQTYTGNLRDEAIISQLSSDEVRDLEQALYEHSLAVQQPYRVYDKGRPGARGAPSSLREDVRPLRRETLPRTAQDLVRSVATILPSAEVEKTREAVRSVAVCEAGAEALIRVIDKGLKVENLPPRDKAILEARKRELEGRDRWALATALAIRPQDGSTLSSEEAQKLLAEALQKEGLGRRKGIPGFLRHKVLRRGNDPLTREDLSYVKRAARLLEERDAVGDYVVREEFSPFEAPVAETGLLAIAESFAAPLPSRAPPVALPAAAAPAPAAVPPVAPAAPDPAAVPPVAPAAPVAADDAAAPLPAAPEVEDPAVEGSMEYFFGGLSSDTVTTACREALKEEAKKIREMQSGITGLAATKAQEVIEGAVTTLGKALGG